MKDKHQPDSLASRIEAGEHPEDETLSLLSLNEHQWLTVIECATEGSVDKALTLLAECRKGWCWSIRKVNNQDYYVDLAPKTFIETAYEQAEGVDAMANTPARAIVAALVRSFGKETETAC